MILFLFFESMLLGAWFKTKDDIIRNRFKLRYVFCVILFSIPYGISKYYFAKKVFPSQYQIMNQLLIFALLYAIFALFASIDGKLNKLNKNVKSTIDCFAKLTLEIYVVQYVIIDCFRPAFKFSANFFAISLTILFSATLLHYMVDYIVKKLKIN